MNWNWVEDMDWFPGIYSVPNKCKMQSSDLDITGHAEVQDFGA